VRNTRKAKIYRRGTKGRKRGYPRGSPDGKRGITNDLVTSPLRDKIHGFKDSFFKTKK
jgi:hypothetical protein